MAKGDVGNESISQKILLIYGAQRFQGTRGGWQAQRLIHVNVGVCEAWAMQDFGQASSDMSEALYKAFRNLGALSSVPSDDAIQR